MWYDAKKHIPDEDAPIIVIVFQTPQRGWGYMDAFMFGYRDSEGIWRSSNHRPIDVLFWKYIDHAQEFHPPPGYAYDPHKGWHKARYEP